MKKHVKTRQLNRDSQARKALFRSLVASLIEHESIVTTSAKARAVQPIFEKFLTKAKSSSLQARRDLQAYVQKPSLVSKMFADIAPRFAKVKGGYTRLIIVGNRKGDGAKLVKLSLTKAAPAATPKEKVESKKAKPTTSSSKSAAKKAATPVATPEPVKVAHTAPKTVSRAGRRGDR